MKLVPLLLGALAALLVLAAPALASEHPENVTLCHAAGLEGTTHYETLTVGYPAAFGPAGHFDENGTPNAGHEQDYLGACNEDPPVDVCPNLDGDQAEVPPGYHLGDDENGRPICIQDQNPPPPPPLDVCPNLEGAQNEIPAGFMLNANNECVLIPPPPGVVGQPTGNAGVYCDTGAKLYRLVGTIDQQTADSVNPATIAGNTKGVTNVVVTRGDTSFRTSVTTLGDCDPTKPPVIVETAAAAVVVTAAKPVTKPAAPAAKPKPKPVRKPVAKKKTVVKKKVIVKKGPKANKKPHKAPFTL